uniref:Tumor necrosis factor receptor superfamily member 14 n=1 Tax=Callorhinchus milii TaxID=7868 RepID=V9L7C2_CALMI
MCAAMRMSGRAILVVFTVGMAAGPVSGCKEGEYRHNGICCPRCPPGERVQDHCTAEAGTTCLPCEEQTHQTEASGDEVCKPCSKCPAGYFELQKCSRTQDTVCDCSEGFHCTNLTHSNCGECVPHRPCPPGQGVEQPGAYRMDTQCRTCPIGSFSDENSTTQQCRNWTDCVNEISPGTNKSDTVCSQNQHVLVKVLVPVTLVILFVLLMVWQKEIAKIYSDFVSRFNKESISTPVQEHGQCDSDTAGGKLAVQASSVKLIPPSL